MADGRVIMVDEHLEAGKGPQNKTEESRAGALHPICSRKGLGRANHQFVTGGLCENILAWPLATETQLEKVALVIITFGKEP